MVFKVSAEQWSVRWPTDSRMLFLQRTEVSSCQIHWSCQVTVISLPVGSGQLQSTSKISCGNSQTCLPPINCLHGLRETCNTTQAFVSQEMHLNGLIGKHCEVTLLPKSTLRAQQTKSVWIRSLLCVLHLHYYLYRLTQAHARCSDLWMVIKERNDSTLQLPFSLRVTAKLIVVFGDQRWQTAVNSCFRQI